MLNLLNWGNTILAADDWIKKFGGDLLDLVIGWAIGPLLWGLCDIFFVVLNLFESIFRTIAGVGQVGSDEFSGDIVLYLIQSDIVKQVFMSIFILSLFLLIIFTIFAIVKNQYADKQEPVSKIINSSFKALLMYLLVPIATVVCLLVGNVVLQAIDGATRPSAEMSASDMLFVTAGYNANKLRDGDLGVARMQLQQMIHNGDISKIKDEMASIGIKDKDTAGNAERWQLDMIANWVDEGIVSDEGLTGNNFYTWGNKWRYSNVSTYYHMMQMSYITVWVGGAFLIWAIGKIAWGLVARMFKMTFYYAISPAVMATFPLDNGKALGSWRGEMVKQGTMAFVAVGVMNVLYTILPFINSIDAIGTIVTNGIGGMIIKLFINIIAFSSAKDLIATISGWFGTGDALGEGAKAQSQYKAAKSKLTGVATKTVGVFGGIKGGVEAASKHDKNKFLGAVTGALSQTSLGKAAFGEAFQKQVKAGGEATKTAYTTHINGEKRKEKLAQWEGREIAGKENRDLAQLLTKLAAATDDTEIQNLLNKIEAKSSHVRENIKEAQEKIQIKEKKQQEQESLIKVFEDLEKTGKNVENLAKRILGRDVDEVDIALLREGRVDASGLNLNAEQLAKWDKLGGTFSEADIRFSEQQEALKELAASDTRISAYIGTTDLGLHGSIKLGVDPADVDADWNKFKQALKDKQDEITNIINDIKSEKDRLGGKSGIIATEAGRQVANTLTPDEYEKIGKNAGK